MYLKNLSLFNFKNIGEVNLEFSSELNCFVGSNGAGKTNLMDSIYYLSFCKSFVNPADEMNVTHGEEFFTIKGNFHREEKEEEILCGYKKGSGKYLKKNQKKYRRFSEHIGFIPLVVVTPSDISLITGGSDGRRKFLDVLISQYDHDYLENLIRYNKAVLQRNKLLKQFARQRYFKEDLLEIWDEQLIRYGQMIYEKRKVYVEKLQPIFQKYYHLVSSDSETVNLIYNSQLYENDFAGILKENIKKDRILQVSTVGVHKDDLVFNIEDYPIKKIGSQGQKKTYLVALKLAQFDFVREMSKMTPILLLDDIFDKLDEYRVEEIIKLVEDENFGQIFITDTNRKNLDKIIQKISVNSRIFQFKDGEIKVTS